MDDQPTKFLGTNVIGAMISLVLYGFYVNLFWQAMHVLRKRGASLWSMPVVMCSLIFIFNLGQTVVFARALYVATVLSPEGPALYYTRYDANAIEHPWLATEDFCFSASAYCADLLMCWRTFIIWNRDKRVLYLPSIIFPLCFFSAVWIIVLDGLNGTPFSETPTYRKGYRIVAITSLSMTLFLTWYFAGLICYRLWSVDREQRILRERDETPGPKRPNLYRKVMMGILQSGIIYSVSLVTFIISWLVGSLDIMLVLIFLNVRIIGIVTCLIILSLNTREIASESGDSEADIDSGERQAVKETSWPVFRKETSTVDRIYPKEEFETITEEEARLSANEMVVMPVMSRTSERTRAQTPSKDVDLDVSATVV